MPLKQILYVSRREAESLPGKQNWSLISISDPFHYPASLQHGWHSVLRLEFSDILHPSKPLVLFSAEDALKIVAFVDQADMAGCEGVLVHCKAGVSRSAAIAKWIAFRYGLASEYSFAGHNAHIYSTLCEVSGK
jgi:predicted protein tyrosine phosphatase